MLTGRVLQRGDVLRISAELLDVTNGWQLWGAQYRRTISDIFATEEEIATEITNALRLKLTPDKDHLLRRRYTDNVEAYHLYSERALLLGKANGGSAAQGDSAFL